MKTSSKFAAACDRFIRGHVPTKPALKYVRKSRRGASNDATAKKPATRKRV